MMQLLWYKVDGVAAAAGCQLVAMCDIVLASSDSSDPMELCPNGAELEEILHIPPELSEIPEPPAVLPGWFIIKFCYT